VVIGFTYVLRIGSGESSGEQFISLIELISAVSIVIWLGLGRRRY
jgi:hypothetical protein